VFGAAHTIDLPLLLGSEQTWACVPLLGQARWADVHQAGQQVRSLWAAFMRSGELPGTVDIPGVLQLRRVTPSEQSGTPI
jgi:para-nitrobenzyl esterase